MGWKTTRHSYTAQEGALRCVLGLCLPEMLETMPLFPPASSRACAFPQTGGRLVSHCGLLDKLHTLLSQCKQSHVPWP